MGLISIFLISSDVNHLFKVLHGFIFLYFFSKLSELHFLKCQDEQRT